MGITIVNSKDILDKDKNPTLCLDPHRYFGKCDLCPAFINKINYFRNKENLPYDEAFHKTIEQLPCKPIIRPDRVELILKKFRLMDINKEIQKEIDNVKEELEEFSWKKK